MQPARCNVPSTNGGQPHCRRIREAVVSRTVHRATDGPQFHHPFLLPWPPDALFLYLDAGWQGGIIVRRDRSTTASFSGRFTGGILDCPPLGLSCFAWWPGPKLPFDARSVADIDSHELGDHLRLFVLIEPLPGASDNAGTGFSPDVPWIRSQITSTPYDTIVNLIDNLGFKLRFASVRW